MTCLICRYFQPSEPPQHKLEREAHQCQSSCGNKWDQFTAINYVRAHGALNGWCRLYPEPKPFEFNHVCGQISVHSYFLNHNWGVDPFDADQNLFEWAEKALQTALHGKYETVHAQRQQLEEKNAELRRQLKRAREVSASRLKRLQKKPPAEPKPEAEPFIPHLVAAE